MSAPAWLFDLPEKLEQYLSALSKLYARKGQRRHQEIVVNSSVRIEAGWTQDEWGHGHLVRLVVPQPLYLGIVDDRFVYAEDIKSDLNKLHSVDKEYIAAVILEMEQFEDTDWRRKSGLLFEARKRVVTPSVQSRIWGKEGFRLFLSHKSEFNKETAALKDRLTLFGVSSFVAHTDIHPTKEWQDEIENALASMDAFVALLTDKFHESDWTDQEVGYAVGRGVPVVAVRLGKDPYGFIGKFQALSCGWQDAPNMIVRLLIKHPRMLDAYAAALASCTSFDTGNILAEMLPYLGPLSEESAQQLITAYQRNNELRGSYGFNGKRPSKFGIGLYRHLSRIMNKPYREPTPADIELN